MNELVEGICRISPNTLLPFHRFVPIRNVCMNSVGFVGKIGNCTVTQLVVSFVATFGKKMKAEKNTFRSLLKPILSTQRMKKDTEQRYIRLGKPGRLSKKPIDSFIITPDGRLTLRARLWSARCKILFARDWHLWLKRRWPSMDHRCSILVVKASRSYTPLLPNFWNADRF